MLLKVLFATAISAFIALPLLEGQRVPPTSPEPVAPAAPRDDGAIESAPQFQSRNPRYEVRPGDTIELVFFPTTEFNQTLVIHPDGFVTLREIGDLNVQGKTIPELKEAITAAYGQILNNPVLTVILKDFETPHFTVGGQVGRPGKYDLRADTTVTEAVAIAGGFTEKAKHSQVLLFRRVSDEWVETKELDLKAVLNGRWKEDIHLRPGDMLFVPQSRMSKIRPFIPVWNLGTYIGAAGL
jgi:polysaccharide biosynthesis/export protein